MVKNLPLRQETQVQSLGQKDRREKDTATYSSILAWSIPRPGYSPWGGKESDMTGWLSHTAIVTLLYIVLYYVWSFNRVWLFETPWTVAHQAPLSMGILQVRILEWFAMPSSRGFSHTEIKSRFPTLQVDSLPSKPPGKPKNNGVGSPSLLQGISLTQVSTQGLLYCRRSFCQLNYQRNSMQYITSPWFICFTSGNLQILSPFMLFSHPAPLPTPLATPNLPYVSKSLVKHLHL